MFSLVARIHDGPITFICEEIQGPVATIEEISILALRYRNRDWAQLLVEHEHGSRELYHKFTERYKKVTP